MDCLMYCEHQLNFNHKENKNDLKQMFQQQLSCTAVVAHNVHESKPAGRVQEGGTGIVCFCEATGYIKKIRHNDEGLGRWSGMSLCGAEGNNTRVITAYNPSKIRISIMGQHTNSNAVFHYKEVGFDMPACSVLDKPHQTDLRMESIR